MKTTRSDVPSVAFLPTVRGDFKIEVFHEDSTGFEVSYSYGLNDYVSVTAGFFTVEDTSTGDDDTGVVVETAFSF